MLLYNVFIMQLLHYIILINLCAFNNKFYICIYVNVYIYIICKYFAFELQMCITYILNDKLYFFIYDIGETIKVLAYKSSLIISM